MDTKRVAIITGAGSGIGKATVLTLFENGYYVVLAGRRLEALQEVTLALPTNNDRTLVVPTDVADPLSVKNLFKKALEAYKRVDLLFNNAGISPRAVPLEDLSTEEWQQAINTNLNGMFYCMQEAFRVMKKQKPRGGRIINNGSISAHSPRPHSAPYTATKHAVTGLTKSASLDGRAYDIACGQIDVGNAYTPLAARMAKGVPQADGSVKAEAMMKADKVANAVLHMASLPLEANIQFMTIMATKMPFIGRG